MYLHTLYLNFSNVSNLFFYVDIQLYTVNIFEFSFIYTNFVMVVIYELLLFHIVTFV